MIKIALLGCGRIGRVHAASIAELPATRLAGLFDVDPEAAATLAASYDVPVAETAASLISDSDVDAVLIATSTETHVEYIEMAVTAGKPVLCEKPIDLDLERVDRCADVVRSSEVLVQIGFNRRFDPGHRAARAALHRGEIGKLQQVIITSRDPDLPSRSYLESAGGLFRDMTIHDFDLARFLLEQEPVEVFASGDALVDPQLGRELGDIDTAMLFLRTDAGVQCQINNSRRAVYGYDQRVELFGSAGMLISDNRRAHELQRYDRGTTASREPCLHFFTERYREAYRAEVAAFAESVEQQTPAAVDFEDGRKALLLAEAAYRSLAERRLVHIDEIAGTGHVSSRTKTSDRPSSSSRDRPPGAEKKA